MKILLSSLRLYPLFALLTALTLAMPGRAQVVFSFVTPEQTAPAESTLGFDINLVNGSQPARLDGLAIRFDDLSLIVDDSPFLDFLLDPATPDPLPSNYQKLSQRLFNIDLSSTAPGLYTGTATISYDTDGITIQESIATFRVNVTNAAAPEPTTGLLFLTSLTPIVLYCKKNRHSQRL